MGKSSDTIEEYFTDFRKTKKSRFYWDYIIMIYEKVILQRLCFH